MTLEVIVSSSKSVVCSMWSSLVYEFFVNLCGQFEHTMSQGCWFVLVSIGIVVVIDVKILRKCRLLNVFGEDLVDGAG